MGANAFPRELRLLTPTHFEFVFKNAIPASSQYITLLARHNQSTAPRLGITLSKKRIKTACQRNRVKRLIRESFRHARHQLPDIDIIVVGKSGLGELSNAEITHILSKQWKRLSKRCNASASA